MSDNNTNTLILLSGGIDSTACTHFLLAQGYNVRALFIDYGQASNNKELNAAVETSNIFQIPLEVLKIESSKQYHAGEIIGRNGFLLFTALLHSGLSNSLIAIGIHSGTNYYDCSNNFTETISKLFQEYTNGRVELLTPFLNWNKIDIYHYCIENNIPIGQTVSCENETKKPCGSCLSCKDREILSVI